MRERGRLQVRPFMEGGAIVTRCAIAFVEMAIRTSRVADSFRGRAGFFRHPCFMESRTL